MNGELIMAYFLLLRIIQRVQDQISSTNVSQLWYVMLHASRKEGGENGDGQYNIQAPPC